MFASPWSAMRPRIVSPPLPMILPIFTGATWIVLDRGTEAGSGFGSEIPRFAISPNTWSRASRACDSAAPSVSLFNPRLLTSS